MFTTPLFPKGGRYHIRLKGAVRPDGLSRVRLAGLVLVAAGGLAQLRF